MSKRTGLIGTKIGNSSFYDDSGKSLPVTILKVDECIVSDIKTIEKHGYSSLQLVSIDGKKEIKKLKKPQQKIFADLKIISKKIIKEFRVEDTSEIEVGQKFEATHFEEGAYVNVRSRSKGKGFAGTIKRHNFKGKDATHGNSISHRTPGSTGQCQFPGRVFKGKKMAGQMGDVMVTRKNLQIVKIDAEKKIILVKGAVPGFKGRLVEVTQSAKRTKGKS